MPRSRKAAGILATELLQKERISDADVLAVLELWYFKQNKCRANVVPQGSTFVHSDTFGVVKSRTGTVVPTRLTTKSPAVFTLLCRWLFDQHAFEQAFPFTSISVNYGYAARRHRDGNNVGPSVAKSLGHFTGGRLKYWADDNCERGFHELNEADAQEYDTKSQIVLFDGRRCHCVTPFSGERYSLVFFTSCDYWKTRAASVQRLVACSVLWPTDESLSYFTNLLRPPKGGCQSIRHMFGYEDKPGALQPAGRPLTKLPADILERIVSFEITPLNMYTFTSLCKLLKHCTIQPGAWAGSHVDTASISPFGKRAYSHYKLWVRATCVINGPWSISNVCLLMHKGFFSWRWQVKDGTPFVKSCGKTVCVSAAAVQRNISIRLGGDLGEDLAVGISSSHVPRDIVTAWTKGSKKNLFVGVSIQARSMMLFSNIEIGSRITHIPDASDQLVTIKLTSEALSCNVGGLEARAELMDPLETHERWYAAAVMSSKIDLAPCLTIQ